jgi:hypothetical protein
MGALVALAGVLFAGLLPFASANFNTPALKVQAADSTLQVCVDQSGKPLTGDIELMLVMDNSTSLKDSDPGGVRFSQVETLLQTIHDRISVSKNPRAVKFSLISFGKEARRSIKRSEAIVISDSNIGKIRKMVEQAAPGNDPGTDYVKALETAINEMQGTSENCRVIVWFTDGAYFTDKEVDSEEGGKLRDAVCREGGISQKLREFNINIFPLYIEPKEVKGDRTASKDVMAHLTGDADAFEENPYSAGKPCAGALLSHIGEVLDADDVNQLGQFFADLTNIIEGGIPVACPTKNGSIESKPLPSGRYISQISIVKYSADGEELEPEDLQAVQPDGESQSLDKYFEGDNGRYVANDAARELQPGWKIKGTESIGSEHCIRAFARQGLSVQIKKSEGSRKLVPIGPEKVWLEGEDLTSAEGDVELPVVRLGPDANCQTKTGFATDTTGLDEAFNALPEGGTGVICVDPSGSKVFARGVSIAVTRDDQPLISCDALVIRREGSDEFIKPDKTERSNTCEIDFSDTNSKFIKLVSNFNSVFAESIAGCNIDASKSSIESIPKDGLVSLSFRIVLDQNERTNCSVKDRDIVIEYERENGELVSQRITQASIVLDLQPEPDRLAALIATILTVLILVGLALAILRRMTVSAAALIPSNKMCAAKFNGIAKKFPDGRIDLSIENRQFRDVQVDMERIEKTRIDGNDSKIAFSDASDEIVIRREMPPIRLMLRDPWAWVDDDRTYVVQPTGRRAPAHLYLPAPFRDAIVALDDGPLKGSSTERLVTIWVIQKKGASQGDQVAIEESLKENGASVVETLFDVVGVSEVRDSADAGTEPPTAAPQGVPDTGSNSVPPPPSWDSPPDWN